MVSGDPARAITALDRALLLQPDFPQAAVNRGNAYLRLGRWNITGGAKDVATKIGYVLQESGYNVVLAGVKSSTAANLTGYDIIVVGGPIYGSKPSSTIQSYLNNLNPPANSKVGVFGYGDIQIDSSNQTLVTQEVAPLPSDSTVTLTAAIKITPSDNVDSRCQEFVNQLK
jgi:flavodoxin